jgi:hypothetical protein
MARYCLEAEQGAVKSVQQNTLGSTVSASSKDTTITAVDYDNTIVFPSGGSEDMSGAFLAGSATLREIWRHNTTHYWRRTATVVEFYG